LFSFWQRKAKYTFNKCSLILNKKIEPAIDTLMKISIGMKLTKKVNLTAYKEQLISSESGITKTSELLFDHPLTTNRIKKMVAFWRINFIIN
jgi:Zn-dependent protease with chaperone function